MSVVNLLLGAFVENEGKDVTSAIQKRVKVEVEKAGVSVGVFELATTRDAVTENIKSNRFDVVICQEWLSGESLGGGTITQWKNINPRIKIILIVDTEKKSGKKLENLYRKHQYYDAIYNADMTGETIASLINNSRSRDAAFEYYGLETKESSIDSNENVLVEQNNSEEEKKREKVVEEAIVDVSKLAESASENDNELDDDEFEAAIRNMGHLFQDETEKKELPKDVDEEELLSGTSSIFGNTESVTESVDKEDEELLRGFEELQQMERSAVNEGGGNFMIVPAPRRFITSAFPTKGIILNVMDRNLLMLGFEGKPLFAPGDDVSNYRMTVLVNKGQKGHIEDGKYSTGLFTIVAYGNCMVDDYTAILEVPDIDLFALREHIKEKSCNLVLVRHTGSGVGVSA